MKGILKQIFGVIILISLTYSSTNAQEDQSSKDKAQEAANNLANPNATIGFLTFPTDITKYQGTLPGADEQLGFRFNFQPSLPYKIGESMNLFVRPLFPFIVAQPVYSDSTETFGNTGFNLGDISVDVALGKSWKGGIVTMIGGFVSFPTATHENLGSKRYLMGPEFVLGQVGKWGSSYLLLFYSWSVNKNDEGTISALGGQLFYTVNLKNAWQIQGQPVFAYNPKAPEGSQWTLPFGGGISKTFMAGNMPLKLGVQYWYYFASPEQFGKQHQIRILITPVVPLPW